MFRNVNVEHGGQKKKKKNRGASSRLSSAICWKKSPGPKVATYFNLMQRRHPAVWHMFKKSFFALENSAVAMTYKISFREEKICSWRLEI